MKKNTVQVVDFGRTCTMFVISYRYTVVQTIWPNSPHNFMGPTFCELTFGKLEVSIRA